MSLSGAITDLCALDVCVSPAFFSPLLPPSHTGLPSSAAHRAIRLSRTRAHSEWIKSRKEREEREREERDHKE